jgi:hydrogenase maturation factor
MTADLDIWRAAAILVKRHGADGAAIVAAQRGDQFRAKGDEDGYAIWKATLSVIRERRQTGPEQKERVN